MTDKKIILISVIIPVNKLSYYLLFENLPAFADQTFKHFEVIVLPNEHSQYDLTLLKKYSWLRIIPTGSLTKPAEKRNLGAKNAVGKYIAFIDDDAFPKTDWLEKASELLSITVPAVCGPGILPARTNYWEKIFDQVISSRWGSGTYSYRFVPGKKRSVDDYPSMNFILARKLFLKLGGFKGNYWPGEDSKLCEDLVYKEKKQIIYHPGIIVYHHRRNNLTSFLKQHANYGFHRGAFFAHGDKNSRRIVYLLPTFFVIYLVGSSLFLLFSLYKPVDRSLTTIVLIPFMVYLFFFSQLFFKSLLESKNLIIAVMTPLVLFFTHVDYGIIFLKGIFIGFKNKENIYG